MAEYTGLTLESIARMTLPQIMSLRVGGRPLDRGASFVTYEDFARYRGML